jgi:hypothetical protein
MDAVARCAVCGTEIDPFDPDVDTDGGATICGECARARNHDALLWEMDAADGELDGEIE